MSMRLKVALATENITVKRELLLAQRVLFLPQYFCKYLKPGFWCFQGL